MTAVRSSTCPVPLEGNAAAAPQRSRLAALRIAGRGRIVHGNVTGRLDARTDQSRPKPDQGVASIAPAFRIRPPTQPPSRALPRPARNTLPGRSQGAHGAGCAAKRGCGDSVTGRNVAATPANGLGIADPDLHGAKVTAGPES
ncbi:MAG: hypothetical protein OXC19_16925 [Bryobacterales bacterium]|nr:hypothetical protein [Bryobacterales bacterium]